VRPPAIALSGPEPEGALTSCNREAKFQRSRRLRDKRIEAGLFKRGRHARPRKTAMRDKAYSGSPSMSNPSREFKTIDDGHVDVRQQDVGHVHIDFVQRLRCAVRNPNIVAEQGKQLGY